MLDYADPIVNLSGAAATTAQLRRFVDFGGCGYRDDTLQLR